MIPAAKVATYAELATTMRLLSQLPGAQTIPVRSGRIRIGTVVLFPADGAAYAYSLESAFLGQYRWCRDAIDAVRDHWRALA